MSVLFPSIDRYIFRLVLTPMIGVFLLAASLLMLEQMLRLFEFVSVEGGPVSVVFRMLLNLMPEYAGLAIPLGLLLGVLLAFRKLALSSELDVMRAVGWSYGRLLRVPMLLAVVLMGANFAIVGFIQPQARFAYQQLQFELRSGALGASIKVGEFNTLQDRMALRIEASEDEGRRLMGIFARLADRDGQMLSISAREGRFLANREDRNTIILRLVDGTIVHDPSSSSSPWVLSFTQHDLPIDLPALERFRERGGDEREYIIPELLEIGWSPQSTLEERAGSLAHFNFRMVEVAMMAMLPLLALALAIPPKRSTSALGVFVSIVIVVAYHKINQYGSDLADIGRVDPFLALWGPFALLALMIGWMFYQVAFVPGGQPIGFLETAFGRLAKGLGALLRRGRRAHDAAWPGASARPGGQGASARPAGQGDGRACA